MTDTSSSLEKLDEQIIKRCRHHQKNNKNLQKQTKNNKTTAKPQCSLVSYLKISKTPNVFVFFLWCFGSFFGSLSMTSARFWLWRFFLRSWPRRVRRLDETATVGSTGWFSRRVKRWTPKVPVYTLFCFSGVFYFYYLKPFQGLFFIFPGLLSKSKLRKTSNHQQIFLK